MDLQINKYKNFLADIKQRIKDAQYSAMKAVNKEHIHLYWGIGKSIVEKQNELGWGKSVVQELSKDLQSEFVGVQGYSVQNLWNMRKFYIEYENNEKLHPTVGEIGWAHNVLIFTKCKDNLEREFYIRMTKKFGWTKKVLIHLPKQLEGLLPSPQKIQENLKLLDKL